MSSKNIRIGITGQSGFVGTHLFNYLGLQNNVDRIEFQDSYFHSQNELEAFVRKCDVIVHLAAVNRHHDPKSLYEINVSLVQNLIRACENTNSKPHILFSSSTQENLDNLYGKSKLKGRELIEQWAEKHQSCFTGLVIPNVFGPFGIPLHNSFIATFCHKLTHKEEPEIHTDSDVQLIYVGELVEEIFQKIIKPDNGITKYYVPYSKEIKVSEVLDLLYGFKNLYFSQGIIPSLNDKFEKNLFNTFLCYVDHRNFFPFNLTMQSDDRGSFIETVKLNSGGQVSFSTTKPGITRGNHFHTRKAERFAVIRGEALIELRRIGTNEIMQFKLSGVKPSFVDMPIWYTHNIKNIGDQDLYTIFWINEHYNPEDGDTFFEEV